MQQGGARAMTGTLFARRASAPLNVISRLCRSTLLAVVFASLLPLVAHARDLKTIGVLVGDLGNPFFEQMGRGVEDAAARLASRDVRVIVKSSGFDLDRQLVQIDAFIKESVDLLILNAVDTEKVGPAVRRARKAGIVVVAIDVGAEGAQATVTSDNRNAGRLACEYLAKRLHGTGDMLIMNGPPTSAIAERVDGCRSILSAYPRLRILEYNEDCGGSVEGGLAYITEMLAKYPRIDAIFAINDLIGIGADIAAHWESRNEFFIVSVDGSPPGIDALKDPDTRVVASVAQHPRQMAERAVLLGLELLNGKAIAENTVKIPVEFVSRDNVGSYLGWER
jgi:ribose transport system substrate-binding protein